MKHIFSKNAINIPVTIFLLTAATATATATIIYNFK